MSKIIVEYWSQTGNTEAMENAVGEGIKAAGGKEDVVTAGYYTHLTQPTRNLG